MTIFDFLSKEYGMEFYKDEYGNVYTDCELCNELEKLKGVVRFDSQTYFIPKEVYDEYSKIEIAITDEDSIYRIQNTRRPYYRMRGVPVTREQAFDIIRRTDNFFAMETTDICQHNDFIGCMNFNNWLIMKNHYPQGYGWIHTDGTIGINAITQRYPTVEEFVWEWFFNLLAFPYLNLIIAITEWNELPPAVYNDEAESVLFYTTEYIKQFNEGVLLGIYVHDNKVEILDKKTTCSVFKEYNSRYGVSREKFEPSYYQSNNITQVDCEYLRKCVEAYGIDADKALRIFKNRS